LLALLLGGLTCEPWFNQFRATCGFRKPPFVSCYGDQIIRRHAFTHKICLSTPATMVFAAGAINDKIVVLHPWTILRAEERFVLPAGLVEEFVAITWSFNQQGTHGSAATKEA
jgi:hypothetical protein